MGEIEIKQAVRNAVAKEIDSIETRVIATLDETLRYPAREQKAAAIEQARAQLEQVRITAVWDDDGNERIGPLTAEEWCALRYGMIDDPLCCCSFTSNMRDELFYVLRMGGDKAFTGLLAEFFHALETTCDTPAGHPLIEKIRAYYWPEGLPGVRPARQPLPGNLEAAGLPPQEETADSSPDLDALSAAVGHLRSAGHGREADAVLALIAAQRA